jgi:hypothetical protein
VSEPTSTGRLRRRLRRQRRGLGLALATGAVSWAWSEVGFWAHFRTDDNAAVWALTLVLYALVSYLVLRVLRRYPVREPASLFVIGAGYGWLVEGTVANTVYLALPFSIAWTALAWHALLTVVVGWYALPRALQRGGPKAVAWCSLVGLGWGCWSVGWWGAPPDQGQVAATARPLSYAVFVVVATAVLALGYGMQDACRPGPRDLRSRWAPRVVVGLLLLWAVPVVIVPVPWAPVVLGALLALAWTTLRRLSGAAALGERDLLGWEPGVPWRRLPPLALVPAVAVLTYVTASPLSGRQTGTGVVYDGFLAAVVLLSVGGSGLLVWSLWRAWGPARSAA